MNSNNIQQILYYSADNFGSQIFEDSRFGDRVARALDESGRWHQRDCKLKAPLVVRIVFLFVLFRHLSIPNILVKLVSQFRWIFSSFGLNFVTPEAICHARARLGFEPLKLLFESLSAEIKPTSDFHGHTCYSMDGSTSNLPDTAANEGFFGRPDHSTHPQMKVVTLTENSTRRVSGIEFAEWKTSERKMGAKLIEKMSAGDLLLMDRGFPAAWLFDRCRSKDVHFLARISSSWKPRTLKQLKDGTSLVLLKGISPQKTQSGKKKKITIIARMISYQIGNGETIRLVTDLEEPDVYPAVEIARLYHARWECEISYDEIKTHLKTISGGSENLLFRSKTPDGILQELFALFGLYNIIRKLMVDAAEINKVNPLDISFVKTVRIIQETSPHFKAAKSDEERTLIKQRMLQDIANCQNPRPRRQRHYHRALKRRSVKYETRPENYGQTKINHQHQLKLITPDKKTFAKEKTT